MAKFFATDMAGFLAPLDQLLLSDFLQLASRLNSQGYPDAAAVLCGSVLEGYLRKLAEKLHLAVTAENGLPKKAAALNRELATKGAYSNLDEENVAGWLDLPKHAPRGRYDGDVCDQVTLAVEGVRDLLDRYPA